MTYAGREWVFIKYDCVLLSKHMPIKKGNKLVELREEVVKGLVMAYGSGLRAHRISLLLLMNYFLMLLKRNNSYLDINPLVIWIMQAITQVVFS